MITFINRDFFSFSSKLDSKGRITVPKNIREKLSLEKGSEVFFLLRPTKIIKKSFEDYEKALEFLSKFEDPLSFSYEGGVLEVVLERGRKPGKIQNRSYSPRGDRNEFEQTG